MKFDRFQLVDRVLELNLAGKEIRCEATVPHEHPIFEGHFPRHPLMPGVLLLEAMAQTSGWLIIGLKNFERMPFLAAVRDAKFRAMVKPGEHLKFSAKLTYDGAGFAITQAKGENATRIVCDATITFGISEFPDPSFKDSMREVADIIGFPMEALANE